MFYCYIIHNEHDRTYNGYTVNLERRLRQHNGVIKGGARYTKGKGPWEFCLVITSPCWDCISTAMQHEWSIKYPTRRRPRPSKYNGVVGRLNSFADIFKHMEKKGCERVQCFVKTEHVHLMESLSEPYAFVQVEDIMTMN